MYLLKINTNKSDFYNLLNYHVINEGTSNNYVYLTSDEKNFIYEYLDKIGKFDKNTQLEYLKSVNNSSK